jgi:hypothetical protein
VLIKEKIGNQKHGIDYYIERTERHPGRQLAPQSPGKTLEGIYTEPGALKESHGKRAQKHTRNGHYKSRYEIFGLFETHGRMIQP